MPTDSSQFRALREATAGLSGRVFIEELSGLLPESSSVLELGTGGGHDLEILKKRYSLTGSDADHQIVDSLRDYFPDVSFETIDANSFSLGQSFSCIYSNKLMQLIPRKNLETSLTSQVSVLKPSGFLAHQVWFRKPGSEEEESLTRPEWLDLFSGYGEIVVERRFETLMPNDSIGFVVRVDQQR